MPERVSWVVDSSTRAMPKSRITGVPSAAEHDVVGLDVAVDEAPAVRVEQGGGNLVGDGQRLVRVEAVPRSWMRCLRLSGKNSMAMKRSSGVRPVS